MNSTQDYSKIFNHLCHMVVLSQDGQIQAVVNDLVLTIIAIEDPRISTIEELSETIEVYFGISLPLKLVQTSVDNCVRDGWLYFENAFILASQVKAQILERIDKARQLENEVRDEWLESIDQSIQKINSDQGAQLWSCLRTYMAKAFQRHGAETTLLLDPHYEIDDENKKNLSTYLQEAIHETCTDVSKNLAEETIRYFFGTETSSRVKYVAQLLDGTFTYFALAVDQATSSFLKGMMSSASLFLDTNFIFGVLGLHSNPLDDVSVELITTIKQQKFPFKLYYHQETLSELERTIAAHASNLQGRQWTQNTSRIAVSYKQLTGLEMRYHERNAIRPTSVDIFLSKYNHISTLLSDYDFTIYRLSSIDSALDQERHLLVAEYQNYNKKSRPHKPKLYEALNHDIAVWQTTKSLRKASSSVLDAGAFFLTSDYDFYSFDRQHLRKPGDFGLVVLPNQFLQLLRPFIPATDDFNKSFFDTFAIPEFRTINASQAKLSSRVLGYLNMYAGLNEQTAIRILTDDMLNQKLSQIPTESEEFEQLIQSEIVRDNQELREEKNALEAELEATRLKIEEARNLQKQQEEKQREKENVSAKQIRDLEERIAGTQTSATDQITKLTQSTEQFKTETEQKIASQEEELRQIQKERDRYRMILRLLLAGTVTVVGISAVIMLPKSINWPWLSNHPKQLGLQISAILIILAIAWIIADKDKTRRGIAFGSVIVAIVAGIVQII